MLCTHVKAAVVSIWCGVTFVFVPVWRFIPLRAGRSLSVTAQMWITGWERRFAKKSEVYPFTLYQRGSKDETSARRPKVMKRISVCCLWTAVSGSFKSHAIHLTRNHSGSVCAPVRWHQVVLSFCDRELEDFFLPHREENHHEPRQQENLLWEQLHQMLPVSHFILPSSQS